VDSAAEKEVIRIAYPYLDVFIVQTPRKSTDLFTFAEELEILNFCSVFESHFH